MKVKKIPQRTCVVTQEKCDKKDLIRVVKTPLNEVVIDLSGKINGRGAYLKKDLEVIEKAISDLYMDRAKGILSNDDFYKIKDGLDNDRTRYQEKVKDLEIMLINNKAKMIPKLHPLLVP